MFCVGRVCVRRLQSDQAVWCFRMCGVGVSGFNETRSAARTPRLALCQLEVVILIAVRELPNPVALAACP